MSDRYLCRAKRTDNGEWVEGYLIKDIPNPDKAYIGYLFGVDDDGTVHDVDITEVDPSTICQCTGIEDKNGKSIFEGDIVRAIYKPKDEDLTTDDFIIKWDKYYCKYVGHYAKKENVYNPLLLGSQTSFEVIGNIFDNPELLKGGAE